MRGHDLIVMGASAGGVEALSELVAALPADLPAAVCVVLHLGPGPSALPQILGRSGRLPAAHPVDKEPLRPARIYVAPPDTHLLVVDGWLRLDRGPRENSQRPSIDALFRSAARCGGPRVVGVLLTGNLDDGTAGLRAIKELGGIAIVQDPDEADYRGMLDSAIANVAVDHVAPLALIAPLLIQVVHLAAPPWPTGTAGAGGEAAARVESAAGGRAVARERIGTPGKALGTASGFVCPDCGGALWESRDQGLERYRCRTGHAFSPDTLADRQAKAADDALWAALRSLEEKADLSRHLATRLHLRGLTGLAERFQARAAAAERHMTALRAILDLHQTDS